jgi:hypothetical protein
VPFSYTETTESPETKTGAGNGLPDPAFFFEIGNLLNPASEEFVSTTTVFDRTGIY